MDAAGEAGGVMCPASLERARIRGVNESATDPLIRFADLSPARRGTAKGAQAAVATQSRSPRNLLLS